MASRLAIITTLGDEFPSNELPGGGHISTGPIYGGGHPSGGPIYGGGYPSHGLPGGGHISTLPVFPYDPTKPVDPDKPPPVYPTPGPIAPGMKFVVKWLCGVGLIGVPEPPPTDATPKK